jgi:hypothetical protein
MHLGAKKNPFIFFFAIQGDQIGRIFEHWVVVWVVFMKITEAGSVNLLTTFSQCVSSEFFATNSKLGYLLGYILGDFFTNSSGHPAAIPTWQSVANFSDRLHYGPFTRSAFCNGRLWRTIDPRQKCRAGIFRIFAYFLIALPLSRSGSLKCLLN